MRCFRSLPCGAATIAMTWLLAAGVPAAWAAEYRTIEVREPAGLERSGWPVVVGVPVPEEGEPVPDEQLTLVRVEADGALVGERMQVLGHLQAEQAGDREPEAPAAIVEIVFLADLPADATVAYRLYFGEPDEPVAPPADGPQLNVEPGEGLGATVDTGAARFEFHEASGQLLSYQRAGSEHKPMFVQGDPRPVQHNPDVWSPPHAWGHVSKWNIDEAETRPEHEQTHGPLAWRTVRHGRIPRATNVEAAVTYTAFAGVPFLLESSLMRFTRDTRVNAVRNNELVFNRGQHTHGVYIGDDQQPVTARGYDPDDPDKIHGNLGVDPLPPDIPFIGLFHDTHGHGIGMVTLDRFVDSPRQLVSAQDAGARYYFNDYGEHTNMEMNFLYFCRGEVTHPTVVPAGAIFAERSAALVFDAGDAQDFAEVLHWLPRLRHPPQVSVE